MSFDFNEMEKMLGNIIDGVEDDEVEEVDSDELVEAVSDEAAVTEAADPDTGDEFDFESLLAQFDEEEEEEDTVEVEAEAETPDAGEEVAAAEDEQPLSLDDLLADETDGAPTASQPVIFKDSPADTTDTIPMPEFTTDQLAEELDIRNYASLVTLNTRRWSGKVKDRKASEAAAAASGAQAEAFETQKRLLAGADEALRRVCKTIDDARTRSYSMTLPWSTQGRTDSGKRMGGRLLPHTCFNEYIKVMNQAQVDMKKALSEFTGSYEDAIAKAQQNLGSRFDPTEYPNPADIEDHFGLSFDFHPIPIGADFQGLADQQIQHLSHALQKKNRVMLENAMQETWARAYELVGRAAEKFSEPKALFHYTLIDSLRDAANSLKYLNVTNDAMIEKVRATIQKHLTMADADDIRKDEALRKRLGKIAKALLEEMRHHAA